MRLWVSTRSRHSRSREASDRPPRALPSRRLCRENADSACHRWPYTRWCWLPLGFLRNRFHHLPAVLGLRPLAAPAAAVERDDGGPHLELVPAVAVVRLAVEGGVGQHPVPPDGHRRQRHRGAERGGVVARAGGHGGPGQEVAGGVAHHGQLGPRPGRVLPARAGDEVAGRVPALQPGAVHRRGGLIADQAAVECGHGGPHEEDDEVPLFSSRRSA